jgi:hypothetical protein
MAALMSSTLVPGLPRKKCELIDYDVQLLPCTRVIRGVVVLKATNLCEFSSKNTAKNSKTFTCWDHMEEILEAGI